MFFFLSQQNSNNSNYLALLNLFNTRQSVRDDIQALFGARVMETVRLILDCLWLVENQRLTHLKSFKKK